MNKKYSNPILCNFGSGHDKNVQSDWTSTDTSSDAYILHKPTIEQTTGTSTTNLMSQDAITTAIGNVPQVTVVQETGTSTTSVMSQKATTDSILNVDLDSATSTNRVKINSTTPLYTDATNVTLVDSPGIRSINSSSVIIGGSIPTDSDGSGGNLVCIGYGSACYNNDVAIGSGSISTSSGVAIGKSANVSSNDGTAVGANTGVSAQYGTAVGKSAGVSAQYGTAIGYNSSSTYNHNTMVGASTSAYGVDATSVGYNSSGGASSTQVGSGANGHTYGVSIGMSSSSRDYGTAVGYGATITSADNNYSVALGYNSTTAENSVVSVGDGTTNANYGHRRIVNVADPTNAQDSATKNYVDGKVEDSITDGHTTVAPSGNAVYDALALKSPLASPAFTGIPTGILQTFTATLPSASWTGSSAPYTKAVTVTGILSTDKPTIDLDLSSATYSDVATIQSSWANVYRAVTSADTITFYASSVPTIDIPLGIKLVR